MDDRTNRFCRRALALFALFSFIGVHAGVPPEQVVLDKDAIKRLGFHYKVWSSGGHSSIEFRFPQRVEKKFTPHETTITVRALDGTVISRAMNWVDGSAYRVINAEFDSKNHDVSISLGVCDTERPACSGQNYVIESVSGFIRQYAVKQDNGELMGNW